ncbi:MAG: lanthionine synthetase LanC family protein [Candidatus Hodarchaeales archaeon]|jgi:hypothetical protein
MHKNSLYIIFLVIVSLSVINNKSDFDSFISNNNNHSSRFKNSSSTNDTQTYYDSISNYADILIEAANKSNLGWSWKRVLNFNESWQIAGLSQFHAGYYYGAAGIGDQFIRIYDLTRNTTYLSVAEKAANYIIHQGIIDFERFGNYYVHWTRAIESASVYTGMKYGYTGIVKFLLNLYQKTNNNTYLDLAKLSLDSLIHYQRNDTSDNVYWGYNIWTDSALTGYTYGSAGIGEVLLDAYMITNNQTYLDKAIHSVDWILKLTKQITQNDTLFFAINASTSRGWNWNISGLFTGSTGVGNYFLKLYKVTQDSIYLDYSMAIGNWLIATMEDGYWQLGAVDFLTEIDMDQGYFYGLAAGSAGIGLFFLNLFDISQDLNYLYPINRIFDALSEQAIFEGDQIFWTAQKIGYWSHIVYTGLGFGIAGIGKFYAAIFDFFGNYKNETVFTLIGIDNYYKSIANSSTGYIPHKIPADRGITEYHSDYFDGIGGIIDFYIDSVLSLNKTQPIYLPTILESASTLSTSLVITSTGVSSTTVTSISLIYLSLVSSALVFIFYKKGMRKRI